MRELDYKKLVLEEFDRRFKVHRLPQELIAPTRKDLKELSIQTCLLRYEIKDEPIMGSFFGTRENKTAYQIAIQNSMAEQFRTLNNFLNDREIEPSMKNINMLAWLMDFKPRPFHPDLKIPEQAAPTPPIRAMKQPGDDLIENDKGNGTMPPPKNNHKRLVATFLLLIGVFIAGYFFLKKTTGNEKCMYWKEDHYEPISCNEKPADPTLVVIALDQNKLKHLKKITRADTLTAASIGKVWYAKLNGEVEYYTSDGQHPLYPERRLLPLTATILNDHYSSRIR